MPSAKLRYLCAKCGKCKPLYANVIERCVTLPVGTWSVAREQSFRFDGGHVHNVTTSHFERKETKFVSNKTAIYRRKSLFCLSSLCQTRSSLCLFFLFIRPITYTRASREHAFDGSGSSKPELQQRWQWESANVRQKSPSPQTLRSPKIRDRLVVPSRSTARSCRSMSSYRRVLVTSSRVLAARSEPGYFFRSNFGRFRFCLGTLFEFFFALDHEFFLRNDEYRQEVKISSKCPTSAMASPHVKYVKGC